MDNLALKLIDSMAGEGQPFIIDSDSKAEWALKKISEERAETQRMVNVCQTMINEYQQRINKEHESLKSCTGYLEEQLRQYMEQVKCKETKTQKTYSLPSGKLKVKFSAQQFERDEKILGEWLKSRNYTDFYEETIKPKWGEFKKVIAVSGENVVDPDTGEKIEGVTVTYSDPKFEVEI